MAFALQNRGSGGSRYNFKNDIQTLLRWIEDLRVVNGSHINERKEGIIYIEGGMDIAEINRMRGAAGMVELDPSPSLANEDGAMR